MPVPDYSGLVPIVASLFGLGGLISLFAPTPFVVAGLGLGVGVGVIGLIGLYFNAPVSSKLNEYSVIAGYGSVPFIAGILAGIGPRLLVRYLFSL